MTLAVNTGTGLDYWEGLTMRRLFQWIGTWNEYVRSEKQT